MLTPAYAFVNAEKAYLCRSPCEHYGSRSKTISHVILLSHSPKLHILPILSPKQRLPALQTKASLYPNHWHYSPILHTLRRCQAISRTLRRLGASAVCIHIPSVLIVKTAMSYTSTYSVILLLLSARASHEQEKPLPCPCLRKLAGIALTRKGQKGEVEVITEECKTSRLLKSTKPRAVVTEAGQRPILEGKRLLRPSVFLPPSVSTIGGGRGYDDSVPGEVTNATPPGDRTT